MYSNRRHRHLNPANLGCQVALDARFITGIASGGAVATWAGRPGTSVNGTQTTGANQPTYQPTGINGRPAVRFDGINDVMTLNATTLFQNVGSGFILAVARDDNAAAGDAAHAQVFFATNASAISRATLYSRITSTGFAAVTRRLDADSASITSPISGSAGSPHIHRSLFNWTGGSLSNFANGAAVGTATPSSGSTSNTASHSCLLGSTDVAGAFNRFPGDIGAVIAAAPTLPAALLKRLEHALAYSFGIACS